MKYLIVIVLFISSCGTLDFFKKSSLESDKLTEKYSLKKEDYLDHYDYIAQTFLQNNKKYVYSPPNSMKSYLSVIENRIKANNERLLKKKQKLNFHIIKHTTPFFFSLPQNHLFVSSKFISEFVKSEEILVVLMTQEMIRLHNDLYEKKRLRPTNHLELNQLISLSGLPLESKVSLNEWTYQAMVRAQYDASVVLNWIQLLNKNSVHMTLVLGSNWSMLQEELYFKKFLISREEEITNEFLSRRSKKYFYRFLNRIKAWSSHET